MTTSEARPLDTRGIVGLGLAATLVPLNSTMIAVALPDIAEDLDVTKGSTGLLITIYLVVMLVGQPTAGRLTDRIGSHRMLLLALSGFAALSVIASLAGSLAVLVVARGVQAVFGAALLPSTQSLLRSAAGPETRGRSFGLMASFIGAGAAAGPVVGGLVTQLVGWSGVFLINVPLIAVSLVLTREIVAPSKAILPHRGKSGMLAVLARRAFAAAFVTQAAATLAQYSLLLVTPIVLDERGWEAGEIGAALTALTAGNVLMGPVGGRLGDRFGRRRPVAMGTLLGAVAVAVAAVFVDDSAVGFVLGMGAFGFGSGLLMPGITTAALESVPEDRSGSASGVLSMSRYVGSIPASLLLATLVGQTGDGARTLLVIAAGAMGLAVVAASQLPGAVEAGGDRGTQQASRPADT